MIWLLLTVWTDVKPGTGQVYCWSGADKWINLYCLQTNQSHFCSYRRQLTLVSPSKWTNRLKYCEGVCKRPPPTPLAIQGGQGKDFVFKNGWGWTLLSGLGFILHLKLEWPTGPNDLDLILMGLKLIFDTQGHIMQEFLLCSIAKC